MAASVEDLDRLHRLLALTLPQVAALLGWSHSTLYARCRVDREGRKVAIELPGGATVSIHHHPSGRTVVYRAQLDRAIDAAGQTATADNVIDLRAKEQ